MKTKNEGTAAAHIKRESESHPRQWIWIWGTTGGLWHVA